MKRKETIQEVTIIILSSFILAAAISFKYNFLLFTSLISFFIILSANTATKKIAGYFLEIAVKIKWWSVYQYGFRKTWTL